MSALENFFSPLSSAVNATVLPGAGTVSQILSVLNITDPRYQVTVFLSLSTALTVISIASPTRLVVLAIISSATVSLVAAERENGENILEKIATSAIEEMSFDIANNR